MQVVVIRNKGRASLIEWKEGGYTYRSTVPIDQVTVIDGQVAEVENPEQGIPYGAQFALAIPDHPLAYTIQLALHTAGIWSWEDAVNNQQQVNAVVLTALGTARDILALARKELHHGS